MESLIGDLGTFLWAVINNWAGYCTGGVVVALLWLWSTLKQKNIPRSWGIAVAIFFLAVSTFNAWREQHQAARTEHEARLHAEDISHPNLRAEIIQSSIGNVKEFGEQTGVVVWVRISNTGAPSVALDYQLKLETLQGSKLLGGMQELPLAMHFLDRGVQIRDAQKSSLADKTAENPIQTGASQTGLLFFLFPQRLEEIRSSLKKIKVSFADVLQKRYEAEYAWKQGVNDQMHQIPGGPRNLPDTKRR
jgi:hypothetical protein